MEQAAVRAGRVPSSVRLVAVTKTVEPARVAEAVAAGATYLGENYVQEARAKIPDVAALLPQEHALDWHFIGRLQSNKAKYSVEMFSLIHSVDRFELAQEIGRQASKRGKKQDILIEVNLTGDPGRAGILLGEALPLAEMASQVPGLRLRGLMGMAAYGDTAGASRPAFRALKTLWDALPEECRYELSMGMSNDFEVGIEEGATLVRVGTALFGARRPPV